GGRADVEVRRTADGVLLAVDDSGPGIAEADRARVLQRFARVAGSDVPGSGLGLAIVQSIAELHHATLTLTQSPRLGGLRASVLLREAKPTL
ncbi:MAG: sensor histidine kinase, partial [Betaproteobacteria bacterium]|nr:sensor histidine kinase [Betaproteobacteria bacterium]